MFVPSLAGDERAIARWGRYIRSACSPSSAIAFIEGWLLTDVRSLYPSVRVPTLLLYRPQARPASIMGRLVDEASEMIPDARVATLDGRDFPFWFGNRGASTAWYRCSTALSSTNMSGSVTDEAERASPISRSRVTHWPEARFLDDVQAGPSALGKVKMGGLAKTDASPELGDRRR